MLSAHRKHTALVEVNQRVMDALQMYHTLMRENPAYSFPKTSHVPPPYASLPSVMGSLPPQPQMGQVGKAPLPNVPSCSFVISEMVGNNCRIIFCWFHSFECIK